MATNDQHHKSSKWPDLNEVLGITKKFYGDMKESVCEIIKDYQEKRKEELTPEDTKKSGKPKSKAKHAKSHSKNEETHS